MRIPSVRTIHRLHFTLALLLTIVSAMPAAAFVQQPTPPINAFFIKQLPADYIKLEKFVASLKEGGANAIILELSPDDSGRLDLDLLPNIVYLAHQADLNLCAILPTRRFPGLLARHPEWEDLRFDLGSGTIQPTGKLDLFQPAVVEYLASLAKEVSSYSVDAVLLGDDFFYGSTEGMSPAARNAYTERSGTALVPGELYRKTAKDAGGLLVEEFGERFWQWAEFKRDRLLHVFETVEKTALKANPAVKFGIPIPVATSMMVPNDLLARYAHDMNAFRKLDVDFFWMPIAFRDMRARQNLGYKQAMEMLTRIATSAVTAAKDPARSILAVQTTTETGKPLPYSEIEEVTKSIRGAGETGIAYMVGQDNLLPAALTKKMFKRQLP